jgi:hypothetical protein
VEVVVERNQVARQHLEDQVVVVQGQMVMGLQGQQTQVEVEDQVVELLL